MTTVAVLGAGGLGAAMARRLGAEGHDVRLWNRSADKARAVADGAERVTAHDDAAEAVRGADAVLTVLRDADVVESVVQPLLGEVSGVWVQASTVGPAGAARLGSLASDAGVDYLDAPVSGSTQPAEQGTLLWLVAGSDDTVEAARPVLDALGSVQKVGDGTSEGSALKLVVNAWLTIATVGISDVLDLADGLSVDHDALREALDGGPLAMPYATMKSKLMDDDAYEPGFATENALKDLHLAADEHAPSPLLAEVAARLARTVEDGHGTQDVAAVHRTA
ncbi:NAD(P)-dependent oxidoreductase [Nocardioides sp. CFH 31398]|uniref:NAD(P)-dependent oxidoreductase n=1 Tax=Nocardioides sp. CFH 31398 TaxID=2919579 RepID=UPI001F06BBFF|nr:NAD(P)-dependent oxidoreductase [Nocardioides sp. CFH 31398]MCH1868097.1 NAD(P)-dependent oxidoreductase [Nocardioides sp. CFH 31398]